MVATAGEIKFGDGAPPSWSGPGVGAMYFRSTTGLPYARNSQSGIEMPLGIGQKYNLEAGDNYVVPDRYQYITKSAVIVGFGSSITAAFGGWIVVLP